MSEQRRETRVEDPEINVEGDWAAVYNISMGGMCVVSTESVKVGWYRDFTLTDRRSGMSCEITGQVRWVSPVGHGLTRVGIQWVNLDPEKYNWLAFQIRAQSLGAGSGTVLPQEPARPFVALHRLAASGSDAGAGDVVENHIDGRLPACRDAGRLV